jgi:signal transduction histidine kinase
MTMSALYLQVLELITTSPGNLVYHVVLAFSVAASLQAALNLWRDQEFPQGRRMAIGLGLLLGMQFIQFVSAGLAYMDVVNPQVFLPVADRTVTALSLIIIIWLWTFPEPTRLADAASGLLAFLILAIFGLTWVWWGANHTGFHFNDTAANLGWEVLALLLLVLGGFLLFVRSPNGWGYGISMIGIAAFGHLIQVLFPVTESDLPGVVRLTQMVYFPLLWAIPHRFNTPVEKTTGAEKQPVIKARPSYGVAPDVFEGILSLAGGKTSTEVCRNMPKTIAEALLADICLVVVPPGEDDLFRIDCGYDLIREEFMEKIVIEKDRLPMLSSAMQRGRPLRLPASSTSRDLFSLGQILNLGRTGHLLAAFVSPPKSEQPLMGIVLLSPYSDRRWNHDDQAYLNRIAATLAPILQQSSELEKSYQELEITRQNLQSFQELLAQSQAENTSLKDELGATSKKTIEEKETELAALKAGNLDLQETINNLRLENQNLETLIEKLVSGESKASTDNSHLEKELKMALQEIAQMQKKLTEADQHLLELQRPPTSSDTLSNEQIDTFTSIVQDLRQPMSSIVGYTDLLLGESVGILGALQRKFLERIKASTGRMDILLDDLFQIIVLDSGKLELKPEQVDLGGVIDDAIADTRSQFQERGIVLRVDFPDQLPQLQADRDALQQILIQLLKNAGTASPVNGEIFLRTSIYQTEDSQDYVLMQIADQGGGIPKEDLPRVFSRLYRADNPLIQGVGDTGVGLSIVKTLVEAHNGRIWVDTEMGKGSTFSLLIPIANNNGYNLPGEDIPL